jgi:hypothetical protein
VPADTDKRGGLNNFFGFLKNFQMFRFSASFPRQALGAAAALAAISLSPGSAQAFVVTVGGVQYDVTTFTGSYNANTSKFALPPAPGVMPWWGSQSLAQQFAGAVAGNLGFPNGTVGPLFGYTLFEFVFGASVASCARFQGGSSTCSNSSGSSSQTWAQATAYTPPAASVPGPLPALGAGAAFGFSRKVRKRIKLAAGSLGSALPRA